MRWSSARLNGHGVHAYVSSSTLSEPVGTDASQGLLLRLRHDASHAVGHFPLQFPVNKRVHPTPHCPIPLMPGCVSCNFASEYDGESSQAS